MYSLIATNNKELLRKNRFCEQFFQDGVRAEVRRGCKLGFFIGIPKFNIEI